MRSTASPMSGPTGETNGIRIGTDRCTDAVDQNSGCEFERSAGKCT